MGLLLGLVFACGVGCLWFGLLTDMRPSGPARLGRLGGLLDAAGLKVPVLGFIALIVACAIVVALLALWIVDVPAVVVAGVIGGAIAPVAWARMRRERRMVERERAWPAVLSQLADALEAGLAWPAAVALVARSGPAALRAEWLAFSSRLHSGGSEVALDGLAQAGERTADSIVLLLRASLVELPAGGLAPILRESAQVLSERLQTREKARSRASTINTEAAILALSPLAILLLIGATTPSYLNAYRGLGGTIVALLGGAIIFGCYLLMRRLGKVPEPRRTTDKGASS
jgi:tight adherence protein B